MKANQSLFKYPDSVIESYELHGQKMLDYVDKTMSVLPEISKMLGGNPLSLMTNNHKNHLEFMRNIIHFRQQEVLIQTLPWVYKTYASKGVHYDYFVSELNSWKKAVKDIMDQNSKSYILAIYDQMLDWHEELIDISKNQEVKIFQPKVEWTDQHQRLMKMFLKGDYKLIMAYAEKELENGMEVSDLYLEKFQPVMYQIGVSWSEDDISVAHEHLATSTLARVMSSIYPNFILGQSDKGVALVSASLNEHHQLGARMVADMLESNGWDVKYLGANLPQSDLMKLIQVETPDFVCISKTMSFHMDDLIETVASIRQVYDKEVLPIMVGGLAINEMPEIKQIIGADAYPSDAWESAEIASKWWEEKNKEA